jgi:hypothetical protein
MLDAGFIERVAELAKPPVVTANGDEYVLDGYRRAVKPTAELIALENKHTLEFAEIDHQQKIQKSRLKFNAVQSFESITTLSSLCDILKAEIDRNAAAFPLFVSVTTYNGVDVYGSYEVDFSRRKLYAAKSDNQSFNFTESRDGKLQIESAIITLQTQFVNSDDLPYVLDMCGKISLKSEVTSEDNGISQQITVQKGVALIGKSIVKPRVTLRPFRTFIEVEQPTSEYLLRFHDGGFVSLTGADGGAWKLAAKANVSAYLSAQFADLISDGKVVVLQ